MTCRAYAVPYKGLIHSRNALPSLCVGPLLVAALGWSAIRSLRLGPQLRRGLSAGSLSAAGASARSSQLGFRFDRVRRRCSITAAAISPT